MKPLNKYKKALVDKAFLRARREAHPLFCGEAHMTDNWLIAINIVLWLSAALVIGTFYATHQDPEPYDYRIAITQSVEA